MHQHLTGMTTHNTQKPRHWYSFGFLPAISMEWQLIIIFATAKLVVHFLTFSNFELHRDAYLYYAQSEHLSWGYFSAPPTTALLGRIATLLFGNTTFGMRFFPALIGALNLVIMGLAVMELGGRKTAITLASLAYLLSPAYLHVNALFQPVSLGQLYWLLSGYLILVMIRRNNPSMWLWIAMVFGLAFLNKYSIVFFCTAFALSLLISRHRSLYLSKYFLMALPVGLAIILPNLLWQYQHNWPVVGHMSELRETQLVHVSMSGFLLEQVMMNAHALVLWTGALLVLLLHKKEQQYRLFGIIYLLVMALLLMGRGKAYYSLGVYPMLFVFGACFTEKYIRKYLKYATGFLVVSMFLGLYFSLSFDGIPFTTFEKAFRKDAFRWEDGVYHDLPQDMADMTGWREIGQTVNDIYRGLGEEERRNCEIFCDHYGQAGAVMFYGKKSHVPQPISFNDNFPSWAPDTLTGEWMIWVHHDEEGGSDPDSLLSTYFRKADLMATIDNPYFRENGTRIYLCESPGEGFRTYYRERMAAMKGRYRKPAGS